MSALAGQQMRVRVAPSTTRGFTDDVKSFDFSEVEHGIMKHRIFHDGRDEQHPMIFPNILRVGNATQIRVPIDDARTQVFIVHFDPAEDGSAPAALGDPPVTYIEPYKSPSDDLHPRSHFRMDETQAQDHMAWETQGPIADREHERLATSDRGIVMLREMIKREIARVQAGLDPKGVVRDPDHAMIDTSLAGTLTHMRQGRLPIGSLQV